MFGELPDDDAGLWFLTDEEIMQLPNLPAAFASPTTH